jgi:hypothetical protein
MDRALVAIQNRREFTPQGGKLGVYFGGVVQGIEGQLEFGTYDPIIQAHIVLGQNVDIEWDEAPGKEYQGKPTVKRTVRQLFVAGKPIVEKQSKPFSSGFGRREDNPETRASIEAQTAVNAVVELLNADKPLPIDEAYILAALRGKVLAWCDMKLDAVLGKPAPTTKPASVATSPTVARKPAPEGLFAGGDTTPTERDNTAKEDFVEACTKAGYSVNTKNGQSGIRAWMLKAGKTNLPFDELAEAKQAELIHMMKCEELEA